MRLRNGVRFGLVICGPGATARSFSFGPVDGDQKGAQGFPEGTAMSKFAPSVRQWGSDEFALRLNELLALIVSLFLMAGIAMLAFIACAVLQ